MNRQDKEALTRIAESIGQSAESLYHNAQNLINFLANSEIDDEVVNEAQEAARKSNAAIERSNEVRARIAAGTATQDEVDDVEQLLAAVDQSVADQLVSLRKKVADHGRQLEEQANHVDELRTRMGVVETGQGELADQIGELRKNINGDDDNPGLARRVTNVEDRITVLERNGGNGDEFSWGWAIAVLLFVLVVCWFVGWLTFGWVLGIGIGAVLGAVLGLTAGRFFRHRN